MSAAVANPLPAPSTSKTHSQQPPHLELWILTTHVNLYPQPPDIIESDADARSALKAGPPDTTSPSAFTRLLSGPLGDFLPFSGQEQSRWLIDIAHDVCDPAHKRGSLRVSDAAGQWRDVNPTDPLTASIYLYDVQTVISLSKISKRAGKSKTSVTGDASTMADRVHQRDKGRCWVTRGSYGLANSHVCPKRMGNHQLRVIYDHFVSPHPLGLSICDVMCGITLEATLDRAFDAYELGLRHVGEDQYECHFFPQGRYLNQTVSVYGPAQGPAPSFLLHGLRISPPQPERKDNPPPGLIRWHYLQCVIRKFVHSDYATLQNIIYYELPHRTEGDSDDEGTNSELDWPSALSDRGRATQAAMKENEDRRRSIAGWAVAVS